MTARQVGFSWPEWILSLRERISHELNRYTCGRLALIRRRLGYVGRSIGRNNSVYCVECPFATRIALCTGSASLPNLGLKSSYREWEGKLLVVWTAGTRVPVPSSHFTKLARTLARSRRRIEESEGEGSASIMYCACGTCREAARRPPPHALRRSSGNTSCSLSSSLSAIAVICVTVAVRLLAWDTPHVLYVWTELLHRPPRTKLNEIRNFVRSSKVQLTLPLYTIQYNTIKYHSSYFNLLYNFAPLFK